MRMDLYSLGMLQFLQICQQMQLQNTTIRLQECTPE